MPPSPYTPAIRAALSAFFADSRHPSIQALTPAHLDELCLRRLARCDESWSKPMPDPQDEARRRRNLLLWCKKNIQGADNGSRMDWKALLGDRRCPSDPREPVLLPAQPSPNHRRPPRPSAALPAVMMDLDSPQTSPLPSPQRRRPLHTRSIRSPSLTMSSDPDDDGMLSGWSAALRSLRPASPLPPPSPSPSPPPPIFPPLRSSSARHVNKSKTALSMPDLHRDYWESPRLVSRPLSPPHTPPPPSIAAHSKPFKPFKLGTEPPSLQVESPPITTTPTPIPPTPSSLRPSNLVTAPISVASLLPHYDKAAVSFAQTKSDGSVGPTDIRWHMATLSCLIQAKGSMRSLKDPTSLESGRSHSPMALMKLFSPLQDSLDACERGDLEEAEAKLAQGMAAVMEDLMAVVETGMVNGHGVCCVAAHVVDGGAPGDDSVRGPVSVKVEQDDSLTTADPPLDIPEAREKHEAIVEEEEEL